MKRKSMIGAALAVLLMTGGTASAECGEDQYESKGKCYNSLSDIPGRTRGEPSGAAKAFTKEQDAAIRITSAAEFAGLDDHCPRFKLIKRELYAELKATGITSEMMHSAEMDSSRVVAIAAIFLKYKANPSDFCSAAWELMGTGGTYRRQMLEAK